MGIQFHPEIGVVGLSNNVLHHYLDEEELASLSNCIDAEKLGEIFYQTDNANEIKKNLNIFLAFKKAAETYRNKRILNNEVRTLFHTSWGNKFKKIPSRKDAAFNDIHLEDTTIKSPENVATGPEINQKSENIRDEKLDFSLSMDYKIFKEKLEKIRNSSSNRILKNYLAALQENGNNLPVRKMQTNNFSLGRFFNNFYDNNANSKESHHSLSLLKK
jgi:hypothetical protein